MNRATGIVNKATLGALLAVQIVVVGVLLAARSGGIEEPEPFLAFDVGAVDSLSVSNDDGSVTVSKVDGAWQLPSGVPAASVKVDSVVEKLGDASPGWPVANTQSTRERFEVTEDNHQRHVTLKAGAETVVDIYLGTSPGYRKTHARRADDDDVYAIPFSNYEAGVKASDWLDKSLLRPEGELTALQRLDAFELTKQEAGWVSRDGADLDQAKVAALAGRFSGLSAVDVSDSVLPAQPMAVFAIGDGEGVQTLSLYALEDGQKYVATSDRVTGAYQVSKYIAEQMDKTLADLMPDPPEAESGAAEDGETVQIDTVAVDEDVPEEEAADTESEAVTVEEPDAG